MKLEVITDKDILINCPKEIYNNLDRDDFLVIVKDWVEIQQIMKFLPASCLRKPILYNDELYFVFSESCLQLGNITSKKFLNKYCNGRSVI